MVKPDFDFKASFSGMLDPARSAPVQRQRCGIAAATRRQGRSKAVAMTRQSHGKAAAKPQQSRGKTAAMPRQCRGDAAATPRRRRGDMHVLVLKTGEAPQLRKSVLPGVKSALPQPPPTREKCSDTALHGQAGGRKGKRRSRAGTTTGFAGKKTF